MDVRDHQQGCDDKVDLGEVDFIGTGEDAIDCVGERLAEDASEQLDDRTVRLAGELVCHDTKQGAGELCCGVDGKQGQNAGAEAVALFQQLDHQGCDGDRGAELAHDQRVAPEEGAAVGG